MSSEPEAARVGDGDDSPFVRFKPPPLLRQISEKHSHKTTIELLKEKSDGDDSEEAAEEEPKEEEVRRKEAEPPVGSDVAPPRLVRGKTGLMKKRNHEYDAIAALVAEALPSWAGIDAEEIEVSEVSGHGGSKTFKVAAPPDGGFEPPVVALHSRSEAVTSEDVSEKRLEAASAALTAVGAAPRRLAQGGDWYIVAWAGKALGGPFSSCDAKPDELGKLMAKIHSVPIDWYEPFRAKMKETMPSLARVPDGSHVWWYSARMDQWLKDVDGDVMAAYAATMPTPTSALGRRVVTCHGDFHAGNLVRDTQDESVIRAIDLEFTCVYYAAHDLAYAMGGCCIKEAEAKRLFVRSYIEELSGAAATDEEVDRLAIDAQLFGLPMHIGPLCCLHGACNLKETDEKESGDPSALHFLLKRLQVEKLFKEYVRATSDPAEVKQLLDKKGHTPSLGGSADLSSCAPIVAEMFAQDPSLVAAATSPAVLKATLTAERMPLAVALLENGADLTAGREALLADDAKLLRSLALDPSSSALVDTLSAGDAQIDAIIRSPQTLLSALKPATEAAALVLLDKCIDFAVARDALLADDAKLLCALLLGLKGSSTLIDALCEKDEQIRAAVGSPKLQSALLLGALQPSTWELALRLLEERGVTEDVLKALTEGEASVTPTRALKFKKDIYLEDDGAALPLGDSDYTMEFWIRFDGEHGCFVGFGNEPSCNGCHYEGHGFNHFWWGEDLHSGDGGETLESRWMHLVLRGDKAANKRMLLIDGKVIGEDEPGKDVHDVQPGPLFIGGRFSLPQHGDQGHDPLDGALSEVRLWKRALADGELGMELNSTSPPDDLVRWLCFTEEDAESGNTVRNHAVHGPPVLDMKEDDAAVSANDAKSKWSTRAELGETSDEAAGRAKAVPRQANCLLAFAAHPPSAPLLDFLVAKAPLLKSSLAAPEVLLGVLKPRCATAALRLLTSYDLPLNAPVRDALLDDASGKGSPVMALLLDGSKECEALIDELLVREPTLKAAINSKALIAALTPKKREAALQLIEGRGVDITEAVCEYLMIEPPSSGAKDKDAKAKDAPAVAPLTALVLDESCATLVDVLCTKSATVKAAVKAPATIAAVATPETASIALKLIETFDIKIDDELSGLLLAKDDKGKSKLLELMAKSEPPPPLPDAPSVITVTGARTDEGHGHWPNDTWHLKGESNGRPQWYRKGNPADFIKWDGKRWTLNGMQPKCYFQNKADAPLPPKDGWEKAEMGVSAMPTLSFGEKEADKASQSAMECTALVDKLCASSATIKAAVVSEDTFVAMAKPATAGVALRLIEEKGLELGGEIVSRLSAGQAERMEQIDAGQEYSRTSAVKLCEERGGRLAYRRELCDEDEKRLLINDGKPMDGPHGGHTWTAVLDGDPTKDNEGVGWVQLGVADGKEKVGRNHKENHHSDNDWGGTGDAHGGIKCKFIWCVIEGPPLTGLVLSKEPSALKLIEVLLAKAHDTLVPHAVIAACTPPSAATALQLLETHPSVAFDAASIAPLLAKDGERLQKLALHESAECRKLLDALCTKSAEIKSAVVAPSMLTAALMPAEARLALHFLKTNGNEAFQALTKEIAAKEKGTHRARKQRTENKKKEEAAGTKAKKEEETVVDGSVEKESGKEEGAVSIETFLAMAKPATAGEALKMIEKKGLEVDDELSGLLLAKDDKGNSKLIELVAKSEKEEACAALVDKLCALSATIKAAVVSVDTFLAMAKPATPSYPMSGETGALMLIGHNDGRTLAEGAFLGDRSGGEGWMEQLHDGRGRFVYVTTTPTDKSEYTFTHGGGGIPDAKGLPPSCYRIENRADSKGLSVQPFHEQKSVNQGRSKPRSQGDNTSYVCVWDHSPEKSVWELVPQGGGFLLMLRAHGWARCHRRDVDVYEGSGYLAVADELPLDRRDAHSFYVHITRSRQKAAIWRPAPTIDAALPQPTASVALKLIETFDIAINDELVGPLLAKDDKGNSKLLELMAASEKEEACVALVDKLCAVSATIKAAVVSADTFIAMAKPATAGVALKLMEEKGLDVDDELVTSHLTGQATNVEVSLYSPAAKYLSNDGSFGQCQEPSPWRIEFINGAPRNGGSIRLQAADGRFLRSDGVEGTPPSWTEEKREESVWILLYSASGPPTADTPVQLKSPTSGGGGSEPCLCNDTPTGGWGGKVKGMYSWCPKGRGDAFWNLHGLSTVKGVLGELVLSTKPAAIELTDALLAKAPAKLVPPAIVAACTPDATATALKLLKAYPSVTLDEALLEPLFAKDHERLKKLSSDPSCTPLIEALCTKVPTIKAATTAPAMIGELLMPGTAGGVLSMIKTFEIKIGDELSGLLLAKDDKGNSKLIELIAASEKEEACVALVDKLCAANATIKAAVVSANTFLAMAKPGSAAAALWLVEGKGLEVTDETIMSLLTGASTEYMVNEKKMNWQKHEDAAVEWGGHLTSITSEEEQKHVKELCKSKPCWIGGRRKEPHKGNGPGPEHWEWSDGSPWEYTHWGEGEPNNSGGHEDRVHIADWWGPSMKWNDIHKGWDDGIGVYKRGGRPLDPLVLSKDPAAVKLVELLVAKAPALLAPPAVIAACTPKTADTAVKLLKAYPEAVVDVELLRAKDATRLKKLVLDTSEDAASCTLLVKALCAKDDAIKAMVTSPEMITAAATPETAGIMLDLIESFGIKISEELSSLLLAKDTDTDSSKLSELVAKSRAPPPPPAEQLLEGTFNNDEGHVLHVKHVDASRVEVKKDHWSFEMSHLEGNEWGGEPPAEWGIRQPYRWTVEAGGAVFVSSAPDKPTRRFVKSGATITAESAAPVAALVDKLCASSATIKAAVVSSDMFIAMAKPATAHIALKLIEMGLEVNDKMITALSTGAEGTTDLAGTVWLPTRINEWVNCPVPEEERQDLYLFKFTSDGNGDLTWTGEVPSKQEEGNFGSREPMKQTEEGVWECRAGDNHHGEYGSKFTVLPNGELEITLGGHATFFAKPQGGPPEKMFARADARYYDIKQEGGMLAVTKKGCNYQPAMCGGAPMRSGQHYAEFTIVAMPGGEGTVVIGVGRATLDLGECAYSANEGADFWGWEDMGNSFHKGDTGFPHRFCVGDRVGMLLDCDAGSLTGYKNGEMLGVMAKEGVTGDVHWGVFLSNIRGGGTGVANSRTSGTCVRLQVLPAPGGTTSGNKIGPLVLSKAPAPIKLVELLIAKAPATLVPLAIVTASRPKTAATALKLLDAYPSAVLAAAAVEPLLAKDGARLQALLLDESKEGSQDSYQLVNALSGKSEKIRAAVTAPAMLHAALTPAAARLIVRCLDEKGDSAFVAAATAMTTEAFGALGVYP